MDPSARQADFSRGFAGRFATTHWSLIVAAQGRDSGEAREALAALCLSYWYPVYAFIRRQGHSWDQAQDLTQEFFARLLEKDALAMVDPAKGRFRSFLIAACKHFLSNERDRANAQKHGGGRVVVPLDFQTAESRYNLEPSHYLTPERLFERRWALMLLDQVLSRLKQEFEAADKTMLFNRLKRFLLLGKASGEKYAEAAQELGATEGAVKVAVHRLRRRYRELLREEIGRTVNDPRQIDDEIRSLFAALGPAKGEQTGNLSASLLL
jgi:RNA polymerase sigma-70 factor (ECF subfamily)